MSVLRLTSECPQCLLYSMNGGPETKFERQQVGPISEPVKGQRIFASRTWSVGLGMMDWFGRVFNAMNVHPYMNTRIPMSALRWRCRLCSSNDGGSHAFFVCGRGHLYPPFVHAAREGSVRDESGLIVDYPPDLPRRVPKFGQQPTGWTNWRALCLHVHEKLRKSPT